MMERPAWFGATKCKTAWNVNDFVLCLWSDISARGGLCSEGRRWIHLTTGQCCLRCLWFMLQFIPYPWAAACRLLLNANFKLLDWSLGWFYSELIDWVRTFRIKHCERVIFLTLIMSVLLCRSIIINTLIFGTFLLFSPFARWVLKNFTEVLLFSFQCLVRNREVCVIDGFLSEFKPVYWLQTKRPANFKKGA